MSKDQIIRAWKDARYREGLSPSAVAELPPSPVGSISLADVDFSTDAFLSSTNPRFCTHIESLQCTTCVDCIN
jgi:mersacidin/lichenicidin family type 2 lantibiotic